jgi:RNA polymerase sigma factor (TIGR02999 family)
MAISGLTFAQPFASWPRAVREENPSTRMKEVALSEIVPKVYDELRRLARTYLRGERLAHTLQPTALVHEAYLRLQKQPNLDWQNPSHIVGMFARVMRQTLTNHAVARHRVKRGGADPFELTLEFYESRKIDVTVLNEALEALEALDARQAQIVELRFFGGLSIEEISELLKISPATVKRDWTLAKVWLRRELSPEL